MHRSLCWNYFWIIKTYLCMSCQPLFLKSIKIENEYKRNQNNVPRKTCAWCFKLKSRYFYNSCVRFYKLLLKNQQVQAMYIWDTFVTFPSAYTVFQTVVSDIFPLKVSFTEHTKTTDDTIRLLFLCWLPNIRKSVEITKRKELNFFFLKKTSNHFHQRISVHS